jgi:hypothetical protein
MTCSEGPQVVAVDRWRQILATDIGHSHVVQIVQNALPKNHNFLPMWGERIRQESHHPASGNWWRQSTGSASTLANPLPAIEGKPAVYAQPGERGKNKGDFNYLTNLKFALCQIPL